MANKQYTSITYLERAIEQCKKDIQYHKQKCDEALFSDLTSEDHRLFWELELKDKKKLTRFKKYMKSDTEKCMKDLERHMEIAVHLEAIVLPDLQFLIMGEKMRAK